MLNLDITLLIIFIMVVVLYLLINKLFCKPLGSIIDAREDKILKDTKKLETLLNEVKVAKDNLQNEIKSAKKESAGVKEDLIKEGEALREELIAKARNEANSQREKVKKDLMEELKNAEKKFKGSIDEFSNMIKEKLI